MQIHLTENTEEEEEEAWLPWQREGNGDCTDWVASGEEGMEERGKNGTEEGWGVRGRRESKLQKEHGDTGAVCSQLCPEM